MIYFDNSATTRPSNACISAVSECMLSDFANASSLHKAGVFAYRHIELVKRALADKLGCIPSEILLGPGGTYCNNLAIKSAAAALSRRGNKIVVSSVEHPSVAETVESLKNDGFEVVYCDPRDVTSFENAIDKKTVLVSCMLVNNETGLVLPSSKLKSIISAVGSPALLHIDAVQAFGKIPVNVKKLGCDFLTVSAHKINGPKGIGALYVKKGTRTFPVIHGGEQEGSVIPGTYNTPAAAGFAAAVAELAQKPADLYLKLYEHFVSRLSEFDFIKLNKFGEHAPHIINITFDGYLGENVLHYLEQFDIYVSQGSACSSHSKQKGKTLIALGCDKRTADGSVRVSFDCNNTVEQIDEFFKVCASIPQNLIKLYK